MGKITQKIKNKIATAYRQTTLRKQLIIMYFAAVFVPVLAVGIILVTVNVRKLNTYQQDLVNSGNQSIRSLVSEVTNQIYTIADELIYDEELVDALSELDFSADAYKHGMENANARIDKIIKSYASVGKVRIIFNNENEWSDGHIYSGSCYDSQNQQWFQKAMNQYSAFWDTWEEYDSHHNQYWYLSLFRRIPLHGTDSRAVLVIQLDNAYLRNRIEIPDYYTLITLEDNEVAYSTNRQDYGYNNIITAESDNLYYRYEGKLNYHEFTYKGCISSLPMIHSDSYLHVITISTTAISALNQVLWIMVLILILAVVLPAVIMAMFTRSITNQVTTLRKEMYKASRGDYNLAEFDGCYELTQTYNDLLTVIEHVQERDAKMYMNQIAEQHLLNEQQKMEFKMLASQINPHFLYNTLETIRMKALTAGDRETATAIKLLGKSMRYVLDNTGTEYTTLAKEMDHIATYLQIQRLRFGDRVNYELTVDEGIDLDEVRVLPLLLQPIVENAVLHGLEEVEAGGRIDVHICKEAYNTLLIELRDNGCGMDEETLKDMRENLVKGHINKRYGIGLYNINRRLHMNYGDTYGVTIDSEIGKGTCVTCRLKINPSL